MRLLLRLVGVSSLLLALTCVDRAWAQQATINTPSHAVSDSFYEHTGTSWGMSGKNGFFQFGPQGNPHSAAPGFGGFDPSAGANGGFGFGSGGMNGGFLGNYSQGSRRSFTSVTPSVTVPNGGTGYIHNTTTSPFVTGYVPVVGGYPMMVPPVVMQPMPIPMPTPMAVPGGSATGHPAVMQALNNVPQGPAAPRLDVVGAHVGKADQDDFSLIGPASAGADPVSDRVVKAAGSSAGRPAMSVAQARRMHEVEAAQDDSEAAKYLERGRQAESDGKFNLARIYYEMAARRASAEVRTEALRRLAALVKPSQETR